MSMKEEFSSIDMATAAADGFRDGVASVANSESPNNQADSAAQSALAGEREPVAYVLTRDGEVCYEADDGIVISNVPGDETDLYKWRPVYFGAHWQRAKPDHSAQQLGMVPDALREAVEYLDDNPFNEIGAGSILHRAMRDALNAPQPSAQPEPAAQGEFGDAYQGAREDLAIWKRRALEAEEKVRNQEQIIDRLTLEAQGDTRFGEPSLPAAGLAVEEVEVVAWMWLDLNGDMQFNNKNPLMTVAQHERIVAAFSAQQSAHVSVPRELLERTICRLTHGHEHDKAVRELRALLNGGEA